MTEQSHIMTHYERLGVSEDVSMIDLQKAYRRAAQKAHPDRSGEASSHHALFVAIQESYRILKHPTTRFEYDKLLAQQRAASSIEASFTHEKTVAAAEGLREGWWDHVKRHFKKPRMEWDAFSPGGYHVHMRLPIGLEEAWHGGTRLVTARVASLCPVCHGKSPHCPRCLGTGQKFEDKTFRVMIPQGSRPSQVLRLMHQGHSGPFSVEPGDILLTLEFEWPYPWYEIQGELERLVVISVEDALEGCKIRFKGLDLRQGWLTLPPGLQEGQRLRLSGMGWPFPDGARQDAWIRIKYKKDWQTQSERPLTS